VNVKAIAQHASIDEDVDMKPPTSTTQVPAVTAPQHNPGALKIRLVTAEMARKYARDNPKDISEPTNAVFAFDGEFVSRDATLVMPFLWIGSRLIATIRETFRKRRRACLGGIEHMPRLLMLAPVDTKIQLSVAVLLHWRSNAMVCRQPYTVASRSMGLHASIRIAHTRMLL
jgi:hypothetical protein